MDYSAVAGAVSLGLVRFRYLSLLFIFLPLTVFAQVTLSIPDPYDPVIVLPLDGKGRISCEPSRLGQKDKDIQRCLRAASFYREEFGSVDLRFTSMMDDIYPHPKLVIARFLTEKGMDCYELSSADQAKCAFATSLFEKLPREVQLEMMEELKEAIYPSMYVPLAGELICSWSDLKKAAYQNCLKQRTLLRQLTFDQRREHNRRAQTIVNAVEMSGDMRRMCKSKN